ncbi:MAG TPA: glycoside hydrolase family 3 N-terminal domain-containing protein [Pseudothermotoga sp.]|nr:glycoside hydrolase family 3 N-terminal domain-containing protein [Pseudothermotoga sp.]HOK83252.1 glycoside hydrolase family 3 N-terminal domain-containing protein [Pseudothermotoga sp.]HPP70078.1 glycoside hydrolase family 3 N-terminal domain-containing protein [Pseudothermotoga sp.]
MVEQYNVGGVILYSSVFKDPADFLWLMSKLRGRKILLSTDHEGGQIEIIPYIFPSPGNLLLGRTDENTVRRYCKYAGETMRHLGLNMVFAPVLDLYRATSNSVIGYRSFGSDASVVAKMGLAAIEGYREGGVIPCVKHFPGHGRAKEDSHEELPKVTVDEKTVEEDLYPFCVAIENRVESVMLAHIVFPALDSKPASISHRVIHQLLREQLRYEGLVISDAVEMKALSKYYSADQIITQFVDAGGDMLIVSDAENVPIYVQMLKDLLDRGRLNSKQIKKALQRIDCFARPVQGDIQQLYDAVNDCIQFSVGHLTKRKIALVLPNSISFSKADVSHRYLPLIRDQAKRLLNAEFFEFGNIPSTEEFLFVDLIVDLKEEQIEAHRELSERCEVVYLITRDVSLQRYFQDLNHIVTYSLSPLVMGTVFRRLSQFLT